MWCLKNKTYSFHFVMCLSATFFLYVLIRRIHIFKDFLFGKISTYKKEHNDIINPYILITELQQFSVFCHYYFNYT